MAENATNPGAAPSAPATPSAPPAPASRGAGESATGTSQKPPPVDPALKDKQQKTMLHSMLPMILIFVAVFYFLLWRPQSKQRKEREALLKALKKGDRVVTMGGVIGQIVDMNEHEITLRVDARKDVQLKFQRSAVLHVTTQGTAGPSEKEGQ